ncbi:heterokaryon incompatibility protein-domain-containing protein [Apodospora peruviana]|uniref:Heterokaryon incompatibility protein-domain-containing protein n=1 Tax=Apodospora peruviana TaxID=516989 RepID=A0AAE0HVY1_9PEZI|nr:heterokaryon incompatibility protein-domain-containing protein [Apodospora peruviana]
MAAESLCSSCREVFSNPIGESRNKPLIYTFYQQSACPMCVEIQRFLDSSTTRRPGVNARLKSLLSRRKQKDEPDKVDIHFYHEDHRFGHTIAKAVRAYTLSEETISWLHGQPYHTVKRRLGAAPHVLAKCFRDQELRPGRQKTRSAWLLASSHHAAVANNLFYQALGLLQSAGPGPQKKLPKRLLDIWSLSPDVRLVETSTLTKEIKYIALSYVWGPDASRHLTTALATLADHKCRLPLKRPPLTIRDAVILARQLQVIRYLWVDSLCIVQDGDPAAKRSELAHISDIYSNAYLTLAVASAAHCDGGFLSDRAKPLAVARAQNAQYSVSIPSYRYKGRGPAAVYLRPFPQPSVVKNINYEQEKLHTRGWTFQELMLSWRVLIYSSIQPYWRCRQAKWDCGAPPGIDEYLDRTELGDVLGGVATPAQGWEGRSRWLKIGGTTSSVAGKSSASIFGVGGVGEQREREMGKQALVHWKWLWEVENYSRRQLTNEKDKLAALHELRTREEIRLRALLGGSGWHGENHAAGAGGNTLGMEDPGYAVGIFRATAPVGLLWKRAQKAILAVERRQTRLQSYPSWSWMSFDGPVEHPITKAPWQMVRPADKFEIVSWPETDDYGSILSDSPTSIMLRGVIMDVMIPETDVINADHGTQMVCYDIKAPIRSLAMGGAFEDEDLYKMGTIVFDEHQRWGTDYRGFKCKTNTKLSVIWISLAGHEE